MTGKLAHNDPVQLIHSILRRHVHLSQRRCEDGLLARAIVLVQLYYLQQWTVCQAASFPRQSSNRSSLEFAVLADHPHRGLHLQADFPRLA